MNLSLKRYVVATLVDRRLLDVLAQFPSRRQTGNCRSSVNTALLAGNRPLTRASRTRAVEDAFGFSS